jgi:hypothetical protein
MVLGTTGFSQQDWMITPAARAVNQPATQEIGQQKFLLFLSGVAFIDLTGTLPNDWRREQVEISPDIRPALDHAISTFSIPRPPGPPDASFPALRVERGVPFVSNSAVFNGGSSGQAGFAVDDWRLDNSGTATDPVTGSALRGLFGGVIADLAVRNRGAVIHRLSYQMTLLGRIVFGKSQIIL